MYTKRGAGSSFTAAALRSGNLPQTGANCVIQFYYYLNYTTGRLSVSFRQDGYNSFVFRTTKTTKGKWMMATTGVGARPAGMKNSYFD